MHNKRWIKIHRKHQVRHLKVECVKFLLSKFKSFLLCLNPSFVFLSLGFSLFAPIHGYAAEFRSIQSPKVIAYDAPSVEATKVYIMMEGYPVEIVVNLGAWVKVRDQARGLSWVEDKDLSDKRTVLVTDNAEIKASENMNSTLLATVEKGVILELLSPNINHGWVKVKHRDGIIGYIQSSAIWGLF